MCCLPAGTVVNLQVQLVNTGNINLQVTSLSVTSGGDADVSVLTCKTGLVGQLDDAVPDPFTPGGVAPGHKVVCTGNFTFSQDLLDTNISSKTFAASVATSVAGTVVPAIMPSVATGDGYAATAPVSISAAPSLDLTVNAVNCTKPTIIPAGATSGWWFCGAMHSHIHCAPCCHSCTGQWSAGHP